MNTFFLGIITLACVATAIAVIYVMVQIKAAVCSLQEFIGTAEATVKRTEESLKPTLDELRLTLTSTRQVVENINGVAEDARIFSGTVREMSESMRDIGRNVRLVSRVVEEITLASVVNVTGLKAGIKAAAGVLIKGLAEKYRKTR